MKLKSEIDNITLSYLKFQTPIENQRNIIVFVILFLDFLGIYPLLGDPFSFSYFIAAIIPVAIIHIWAIIYVVAPYKFEHSYYLLMGVYAIVNTYVFFLVTQKLLYLHIGATSLIPRVVGIVFFIGLIIFVNWLNLKALYSETYFKLQRKSSINVSWLAIGGLSYVFGQFVLMFVYSDSALMMIVIIGLSLLSIIIAYFSIYIHRYYFIKSNMEIIKKINPEFGLSKKEREVLFENRKTINIHNPSRKNKKRRKRK